jgi:demethoxyubiquinone hydroxylase (CLK1/Coq7/Cat5 family)
MQTNVHQDTTAGEATIKKLQECLRSELSAEETYQLALKSVTHVGLHHTLQEIFTSHARRSEQLRERLGRLGVEPGVSSGVWGAFARAVQAGADLLGDRVAIAALEAGEDHALALYTEGLDGCDARTLKLIDGYLLPEQRRTHDLCRSLKSYVNAPS